MNFNELFRKISELDKGTVTQKTSLTESLVECGGPMPMGMMGMSSPQQQTDSISANISMNAQGAGGIRDLMAILKNIESSSAGSDEVEIGIMSPGMDGGDGDAMGADELGAELDQAEHPHSQHDDEFGGDEEGEEELADDIGNAPDEMYAGVDAVTGSGNDLNRSKTMYKRAQPGDNPMAMESLISNLAALYKEVKLRESR
jgi:hypothetical protein